MSLIGQELTDQSVMNFAIGQSLEEYSRDPRANFSQKEIMVETRLNSGRFIGENGVEYSNQCAFLSLEAGLLLHGYSMFPLLKSIQVTAENLKEVSRITDRHQMFDTENINHLNGMAS